MKIIHTIGYMTLTAIMSLTFNSCELDNYDGPDAKIHGEIRDIETGELIQQDISSGSQIIYVEHGFENPEEQRMIFKVNGEYTNNLVFSGIYDFYFNESNFVKPDTIFDYKINPGDNKLDFKVLPYIRIKDVNIRKEGNEIVATFKITPTVSEQVREVGLFGYTDFIVGAQYSHDRTIVSVNSSFKGEEREFTLRLGDSQFTPGKEYYFRVGAIIDVPNSKYNYAPSIKITI